MSQGNFRTTDKYFKVKKASEKAPENEIRIRDVPRIGRYISYAAKLLKVQKLDTIILKGSGKAVSSACQIAEILKHRILGLHQLNLLKTVPVIDEYEPKEEGLDKVVVERKLAVLEIHLSQKDGVLDTKAAGYQAPLPKEEVQEEELESLIGGGGRRRPSADEGRGEFRERGEGRGRGRGGRRGFRGGRFRGPRGGGRPGGYRRDDRDRDYDDDRDYRDRRGGNRDREERDFRDRPRGGNRGGENRGGDYGDRDYDRPYRGGSRGGSRGGFRGGSRGGSRGGDRGDRDNRDRK